MESEQNENPHKPLLNGFLAVLLIIVLIFISAKSPFIGLIAILLVAVFLMTYILHDDPENYVVIYEDDKKN